MHREFIALTKTKPFRGWQLEREERGWYLSKFDEDLNDDEYRFFIDVNRENAIYIRQMEKIKSYGKIMKIKKTNIHYIKAFELCSLMSRNPLFPKAM